MSGIARMLSKSGGWVTFIYLLLACSGVCYVSAATSDTQPASPKMEITPCVPGVLYVQIRLGVPPLTVPGANGIQSFRKGSMNGLMRSIGVTFISRFDNSSPDQISRDLGMDRIYVVEYSADLDPHTVVEQFLATGDVEKASARYMFPIAKTTNDPLLATQYALTKMRVLDAWDITTGDSNILIADVDVGTNIAHEDLVNNVKINAGEVGLDAKGHDKRTNGIDDDGDGAVDDWHGWDVVGNGTSQHFNPDNDPTPDDPRANHGTMTAGCIAATGDNGLGIGGVAYGCRLLPIKATNGAQYDKVLGGYEGIHFASTHKSRIINCSWGGLVAPAEVVFANLIVREATLRNAIVVVASGNFAQNIDITTNFPADALGSFTVGATDQNDNPASFSDYGHTVSVYAPGVGIESTSWPNNNAYSAEDGTSFSSPLVAGALGLLMSAHPDWPPKFIERQLVQTCDNVVKPSDRFNYWGRVNLYSALTTAPGPGLTAINYWIDDRDSAALDLVGKTYTLRVRFLNVTADGTNLSATIAKGDGYTASAPLPFIGTMSVHTTHDVEYKIIRTDEFSSGLLPVKFYVTNGSTYQDSIYLQIPLVPKPGFDFQRRLPYGTSVKQVDNYTAWAAFGYESSITNPIGFFSTESDSVWAPERLVNTGTEPVYCVEALDQVTAFFGSGPMNGTPAHVFSTPDGGSSWSSFDVSSFTPFVNAIHFFDPQTGVLVGDPKSQRWGIARTADGGATWTPISKAVPAGSEQGWNNAMTWVGNNGWFGTNARKIYRSNDGGLTWQSSPTAYLNSMGVAFDTDAVHGIAAFRRTFVVASGTTTGTDGLMSSSNGGATWQPLGMPNPNDSLKPADIEFIPGRDIAILSTDKGMFKTTDFGATWTRIGIPVDYNSQGSTMSISSDGVTYVVAALSGGSGLARFMDTLPPVQIHNSVAASSIGGPSISLSQNMPNPFSGMSVIQFSQATRDHIRLSVFDMLGRVKLILVDEELESGTHTIRVPASELPSGIYHYVLETGRGEKLVKQMTIVK